jgi:hypothetical protein
MSLSSVFVKNNFSGLKEKLWLTFHMHKHELVVVGIMASLSVMLAIAMTGNINEAYSRVGRGR